jgi:hypothetical protein
MSTSPEVSKRRLVIHAVYPTAEVFVVDGSGTVVARAVEELAAELPCGFYQIRYVVGSQAIDEFLELPAGEGDCVHTPPRLVTPLPGLGGTRTYAQAQTGVSRIVEAENPQIGHLCVYFTCPNTSPPPVVSELTVQTFDGKVLASLSQTSSEEDAPSLSLDPGCYLLRRSGEPAVERCVYVASQWRTEVMVPVEEGHPDLGETAVFMARPEGADPTDQEFSLAEAARQTLGSRRITASKLGEAATRTLLKSNGQNPMLGIFGAHLMIQQGNPDRGLLAEAVGALKTLVGDHPDVRSLRLFLEDTADGPIEFQQPPMLRSSWRMIVDNSARPGLVASASYAARIGGNLWGSGAWLTWKVPSMEEPLDPAPPEPIDFRKIAQAAVTQGVGYAESLPPLERKLFTYLTQTAMQSEQTVKVAKSIASDLDSQKTLSALFPALRYLLPSDLEKETEGVTAKTFDPMPIASAMGIPLPTLRAAGSTLSKKLGVDSKPWYRLNFK